MDALLSRLRGSDDAGSCRCRPGFDGDRLVVDASDCPGGGRLESAADCRETVVEALTDRDVEAVTTRANGTLRAYEDDAAALLVATGRFVDAAAFHDERLAERAKGDPLAAAREATGRAGPVRRIAAETGLADGAARAQGYEDALRPYVGPTVSRSRVAARPPADARLVDRRELDSGGTVRVYERPSDAVRTYHLEPVEAGFDASTTATLAAAYERLAGGEVSGAERAPGRAVRSVADPDDPVERLAAVLRKHARGYGVVADLFADGRVSDVFATAPVAETPLRVRVDGETMRTNVRLTRGGAAALASRFRRESGRAFSGADPTLDASVVAGDRRVRVAAVTDPVSDGVAFAFRAGDREPWTLPALVANGTLSAAAAAVLSVAVERGAAGLVAGPRGAGKTTCLSALLWEVPAETRSVVIEDTPELPVDALQSGGRDVQALRSSLDGTGTSPTEALRTALRLGSGALVVGEIRGEEAGTLYEAMRVGANDGAVLGTIHGNGGADVRERVVADLGVPASSFAATDFLVTLETADGGDGTERRVRSIEEVRRAGAVDGSGKGGDSGAGAGSVRFAPLFERDGDGLSSTDRIERGNSRLVASLTAPGERYADLRDELTARESWLSDLAATGRTDPERVERARIERVTA
ncbi:ATPase, T2SS/T4P/T4SS family [Halosimplex salinum]|uniref:ATPase, T2SS/T4P/T4SS family n=1 Tax=Halosimplex salinum TaxID=1710538 RepID=UPI000F493933|nr:ATPase, T2SS/T4P/T4SS family [Halosimplex salinum]